MSLQPKEAFRLVQKCIPVMRATQQLPGGQGTYENYDMKHMKPIPEGLEDRIRQRDVSSKSIARLWAGMGQVYLVSFSDGSNDHDHHITVKRVSPRNPKSKMDIGDRRKADSYQVEASFYENYANGLIDDHRLAIPRPYYVERGDNGKVTICMSRLEGRAAYGVQASKATLLWLATLHAATWGDDTTDTMVATSSRGSGQGGLQPVGSYWHLDTRPDEHAKMSRHGWEGRLYLAARAISDRLKRDPMQCIIHGDAKDANMLWRSKGDNETNGDNDDNCNTFCVGMYDFQYCGKAPPTVDLAYYLCVAADSDAAKDSLLVYYYNELVKKLSVHHPGETPPTLIELKESLSLAYCDFARFMCGWGWWGDDVSSEVIQVLDRLDGGTNLGSEEAYDAAMLREFG